MSSDADAIKAVIDRILDGKQKEEADEAKAFFSAIMKEAYGVQRTIRDLARDHLREKGGWIEINGQRFYPGDIPEEH